MLLQTFNAKPNYLKTRRSTSINKIADLSQTNDPHLTQGHFVQEEISEQDATLLAHTMTTHWKHLQELWLLGNGMYDDCIIPIANAISELKVLQIFWLGENKIGEDGGFALAHAIRCNTSLVELSIQHNIHISDDAALAICDAIGAHTALTSVNLTSIGISAEAASDMAKHLAKSKTLIKITLSQCHFENVTSLRELLLTSKTISKVHLKDNFLDESAVACITEALKKNYTLIELELDWHLLQPLVAETIRNQIKVNKQWQSELNKTNSDIYKYYNNT